MMPAARQAHSKALVVVPVGHAATGFAAAAPAYVAVGHVVAVAASPKNAYQQHHTLHATAGCEDVH